MLRPAVSVTPMGFFPAGREPRAVGLAGSTPSLGIGSLEQMRGTPVDGVLKSQRPFGYDSSSPSNMATQVSTSDVLQLTFLAIYLLIYLNTYIYIHIAVLVKVRVHE